MQWQCPVKSQKSGYQLAPYLPGASWFSSGASWLLGRIDCKSNKHIRGCERRFTDATVCVTTKRVILILITITFLVILAPPIAKLNELTLADKIVVVNNLRMVRKNCLISKLN